MVNKTSPIKPKTANAAKAKTLNLDKLLIKIQNISSRCDKNGRITGGAFTVKSEFSSVGDSIKNFFRETSTKTKTSKGLHRTLEYFKSEKEKRGQPQLISDINILVKDQDKIPLTSRGKDNKSLNLLLWGDELGATFLDENKLMHTNPSQRIENRLDFFNKYDAPNFKEEFSTKKQDQPLTSNQKALLGHITNIQIAHTLAKIYKIIEIQEI
jgi:hypothetical protein